MGYHRDTAATVVFQASSQMEEICNDQDQYTSKIDQLKTAWKDKLLGGTSLDTLRETKKMSDDWKEGVRSPF